MQFTFRDRLRQVGQTLLFVILFLIVLGSFGEDESGVALAVYIFSAVSLLLSTLLFYLLWRSPRWERWNGYRVFLLFISGCRAFSYFGWAYAPVGGLSHLLGHILGLLAGALLAYSIMLVEDRAINVRKDFLVARQRGVL